MPPRHLILNYIVVCDDDDCLSITCGMVRGGWLDDDEEEIEEVVGSSSGGAAIELIVGCCRCCLLQVSWSSSAA